MDEHTEEQGDYKLVEIPKIFRSDLTGAPIDKCIYCECSLIEPARDYLIEKAFKTYKGYGSYSTIFEYAICMPCAVEMQKKISTESRQRINAYFSRNMNMAQRRKELEELGEESVEKWLECCAVNGQHVEELGECQIYAQCHGNYMVFHDFPYMISGTALDEVIDLLSAQTLDDLDRFKDEFIDGPSEFQDLLKTGPRVFV